MSSCGLLNGGRIIPDKLEIWIKNHRVHNRILFKGRNITRQSNSHQIIQFAECLEGNWQETNFNEF